MSMPPSGRWLCSDTPLLVKERTVIMNFLIDLMGFEARYALTRHALVLMSARYGHET